MDADGRGVMYRMCYKEFGIVLIAVNCGEVGCKMKPCVNPAASYRIQTNQLGFFIAKTHSDVRR